MVLRRSCKISVLYISFLIGQCWSFAPSFPHLGGTSQLDRGCRSSSSSHPKLAARRRNPNNSDEDRNNNDKSSQDGGDIPQLPAIGASSFRNRPPTTKSTTATENSSTAFVGAKFQLQYTCKVCETRNCHIVSRIAYRQGMVVAVCKGCESKHLIADNLGSTSGSLAGGTNIEDYFKLKDTGDVVNRVSQDVFDLEKILAFDSQGGAISGEDGTPMLE